MGIVADAKSAMRQINAEALTRRASNPKPNPPGLTTYATSNSTGVNDPNNSKTLTKSPSIPFASAKSSEKSWTEMPS